MKPFSGQVEDVTTLDLRLEQVPWAFAQHDRPRIDAHWQSLSESNPSLWNGSILIARHVVLGNGTLAARFALTDYASYVAWRDWGHPDKQACNVFGMPALKTSDDVLVFAEMSAHTLNAGKLYPPGGSLEQRDVKADATIDVLGSITIEVTEETGLDLTNAAAGGLYVIRDGPRVAVMRQYQLPQTFSKLEQHFARHQDHHKELVRLVPIRSRDDIVDAMPVYAQQIVIKEFTK
jgi:8-oxo-dGTP pyrophosphatase MutT (NUDIX family)